MDARLQRRIQRYGWDLAAERYEALWQRPLAAAQGELLANAAVQPGDHVLDVACGTGLVALAAAAQSGPGGHVLGIDISERMVGLAAKRARERGLGNVSFARMDCEELDLPAASFDVVFCALGLMYLPDAERAIREMHRVLRPDGRIALAIWGERAKCDWASLFDIVNAEVQSEVCPLFFRLGIGDALARACTEVGFVDVKSHRINGKMEHADDDEACDAAFAAGPVALAWSRFDAKTRARVRHRYVQTLATARRGLGFSLSSEFVAVSARHS